MSASCGHPILSLCIQLPLQSVTIPESSPKVAYSADPKSSHSYMYTHRIYISMTCLTCCQDCYDFSPQVPQKQPDQHTINPSPLSQCLVLRHRPVSLRLGAWAFRFCHEHLLQVRCPLLYRLAQDAHSEKGWAGGSSEVWDGLVGNG